MSVLTITGLSKRFGSYQALSDINLTIEPGEFVVFVGPSGCGKSTLLRVIAGLEDADTGEIRMGDRVVNAVPPAKRGLSFVFQSYALYPHLTVRGNMSLGLSQEGCPKPEIEKRVAEAARMLALEALLERRPAELSGGQRQRVAIGRAVVRKPKLFLFDEPLSNLDAALRVTTRIEIATLHRSLEAAMIYVTHDQTEAMTLADRIVILRDGRIEQVGRPLDLYNDPANEFVATFLGAPAMNIIDGAHLGRAGKLRLGVRPENLRVSRAGRLNGQLQHLEHLGSDTNLFIRLDDGSLVVVRQVGQAEYPIGDRVSLEVEERHIYAFDESGARLRA